MHVVTDVGPALVKYMGNRQGLDALVCEIVGSELANLIGLTTPDFAIANVPEMVLPFDPPQQVLPGPAFFSRWEEATSISPNPTLLGSLRRPSDLGTLVVFDTWLRNKDRFNDAESGYPIDNYDNLLLRADKRKVQLLVIDHTHAIAEATLSDELGQSWIDEQIVYGYFSQFVPFIKRDDVNRAIMTIQSVDATALDHICGGVPSSWGMTNGLKIRLIDALLKRASRLHSWLPGAIFGQLEMDFEGGLDG